MTIASPPASDGGTLADGRRFGYIDTIDLTARTLTFDVAEFLEGDAADRAAADAGAIEPGEQIENDYFIVNPDEDYATLGFSEDVEIRIVGDPPDLVDGELEPFAAAFARKPEDIDYAAKYRGTTTQYWLTITGGTVVKIDELYLP